MIRQSCRTILCLVAVSCRIARLAYCSAATLPLHSRRETLDSRIRKLYLCSSSLQQGIASPADSRSSRSSSTDNCSPSSRDSSSQLSGDNLARAFLRSLYKGITIPFPALRKILLDTEKQQNIRVGLGLRESTAAVISYLAVGVAAYRFVLEPSWTTVDAMYFAVTCFTTVGYGDLVPSNLASKAFTCVFGLVGISFLGAAIATVSGSIVDSQVQAMHLAKTTSRQRFKGIFDDMPDILSTFKQKMTAEQQEAHFAEAKGALFSASGDDSGSGRTSSDPSSLQEYWLAVRSSFPSLLLVFAGGTLIHRLNGGSGPWWDAIYYSIITASTIGLGDISPMSPRARLAAIVYIPVAVAAAGELLSGVATNMIERRQKEVFKQQLENTLTIKTLKDMDADGSGKVTRDEYIKFMLLEMGLVDEEELDELDKQFDRLDAANTGYLDKEDLALMAKYRGVDVTQ